MPTTQDWFDDRTILSTWHKPLMPTDLSDCFFGLTDIVAEKAGTVHIIFDIRESGGIPTQAPMDFIKSKLPRQQNLGIIAVIGLHPVAQILAQMASNMSGQVILFFPDEESAKSYIAENG